jgi:hypothetical protein
MQIDDLKKLWQESPFTVVYAVLTCILEVALILTIKRHATSAGAGLFSGISVATIVVAVGLFLAVNSLILSITYPWRKVLWEQESKVSKLLAVGLVVAALIVAAVVSFLDLYFLYNSLTKDVSV